MTHTHFTLYQPLTHKVTHTHFTLYQPLTHKVTHTDTNIEDRLSYTTVNSYPVILFLDNRAKSVS